jgi:hypothetical protein
MEEQNNIKSIQIFLAINLDVSWGKIKFLPCTERQMKKTELTDIGNITASKIIHHSNAEQYIHLFICYLPVNEASLLCYLSGKYITLTKSLNAQ